MISNYTIIERYVIKYCCIERHLSFPLDNFKNNKNLIISSKKWIGGFLTNFKKQQKITKSRFPFLYFG